MPFPKKNPWDTDTEATKVALERFMRALLVVDGHFTSSFIIGKHDISKPVRGVSVFFRVWIPEGEEARFEQLAKVKLEHPPKVVLNEAKVASRSGIPFTFSRRW